MANGNGVETCVETVGCNVGKTRRCPHAADARRQAEQLRTYRGQRYSHGSREGVNASIARYQALLPLCQRSKEELQPAIEAFQQAADEVLGS